MALPTKVSQLWDIMDQYETIHTLRLCIENVVHMIFCMVSWLCVGVLKCLSCILRNLNRYFLIPTNHLYVLITFPRSFSWTKSHDPMIYKALQLPNMNEPTYYTMYTFNDHCTLEIVYNLYQITGPYANQCPQKFLGIIGQDPSVSKSSQVHVLIFRIFFGILGCTL